MSERLIVRTEADLAALASLESWQAEEKYRARRAQARRAAIVPDEGARPRSLPSGPAPKWLGISLCLGLFFIASAAGIVVLLAWMISQLLRRIF